MALKGKRKQRGGQGRRKPAAMPRPQAAARKPPWYKTTAGLSILAIGSLLALIVIVAIVVDQRNDNRLQAEREEELETYTSEVEALVQEITEPASGVAAAAAGAASGQAPSGEDAAGWVKALDDAQTKLFQLIAPQDGAAANSVFQQSVLMYRAAAKNFELAADAEGPLATELQTQAATLAGTASALWESAKSVLDDIREEAGLAPSGIRSPSEPSAQPQPQGTPDSQVTIPPADDGEGDGSGGGNGGGGGGNEGGNGDG